MQEDNAREQRVTTVDSRKPWATPRVIVAQADNTAVKRFGYGPDYQSVGYTYGS